MRVVAVLAMLMMVACGGDNRPGWTPHWPEAERHNFNGVTMPGRPLSEPLTMFLKKDRSLVMHLRAGNQPAQLLLEGAEPSVLEVLPGQSQTFTVRTTANQITMRPTGGTVWISVPYIGPAANHQHTNVLLISADTLRADYFTPEHMPRLHALFAGGWQFTDVTSPSPWTLPAHASLFSGLYPNTHGVRTPEDKLSPEADTLAEVFRDYGYYTLAYTEGNYLSATFGLDHGFHRYVERPPDMMATTAEAASKLADNVTALSAELDQLNDMPVFALLHTYEVHCPYLPHDDLEDPQGVGSTQWLLDHEGQPEQASAMPLLRDLYAAEVAYLDRTLAPMVERLLATGEWLVVFTSDHGEEFGEHGGLLHADTLYEEVVRVPLAMAGDQVAISHQFDQAISLVDVPATILGQLRIPIPDTWQGRDAVREREPRPVYSESFFFGVNQPAEEPRLAAVRVKEEKLIQRRNFGEFTAELYHLGQDPGERDNVAETATKQRDALFLYLDAYLSRRGFSPDKIEGLTPEQEELMRSLGYMQ